MYLVSQLLWLEAKVWLLRDQASGTYPDILATNSQEVWTAPVKISCDGRCSSLFYMTMM